LPSVSARQTKPIARHARASIKQKQRKFTLHKRTLKAPIQDEISALEAEHGQLVMLNDAENGLKVALAGQVQSEEAFRKSLRRPSLPK
jgi:hypothetical protein